MIYVYDLECFPNLFTATFVNADDEKEVHAFSIGLGVNQRDELIEFINSEKLTLVGYNSISFDDALLRFVLDNPLGNDPFKMTKAYHTFSSSLIDRDGSKKGSRIVQKYRYPKGKPLWHTIDLMKILAFDKLGVSLKQVSINLKWHTIQDLPFSPIKPIDKQHHQMVLDYNLNDVLITKRLYEELEPIRQMRNELKKMYKVDFSSASDSRIANLILAHTFEEVSGRNIREIRDSRTYRQKVRLKECIAGFVRFGDPVLKEMLDRMMSTILYQSDGYKYEDTVCYAGLEFSLGIGGLHTKDGPAVFESTDEYTIQDMDVASYYPNLIINNKFYPRHLGEGFINILKTLTDRRLDAKANGRKVEADGLKITVNSIFGKLGFEFFWLYDPKQMLSTTLSGQLGLLMLVEGMYRNGIEVLSCNTDGVVCKIPKDKEEIYYKVAEAWEKLTGLTLEFTPYRKYVRRDVNNYITETMDGKIKEKGVFMEAIDLKKAYRMPIVARALKRYFIDGISVDETLHTSTDILDFCISQNSGRDFDIKYQTTHGTGDLQKTNRYYVSNSGGGLVKVHRKDGRVLSVLANNYVRILNKYDKDKPFEEYDLKLGYYKAEIMKIIDVIEPPAMTLF